MKQNRILVTALVLAMSVVSHIADAQTTTTATTGTTTGTSGTTSTTGTNGTATAGTSGTTATTGTTGTTGTSGTTATTGTTGTNTTAVGTPLSQGETRYVSRIAPRFEKLAGSSSNLESLVHGLRTGSEVKLTTSGTSSTSTPTGTSTTSGTSSTSTTAGTSTTSSTSGGGSATFAPATRPMGYGNITRVLSLAGKQLAAAGVTNPTPQDLAAALNGGTVKTAQGSTTFEGVLKLRSEGMGWGKIAHTIGVHPGMGKTEHHATRPHSASTVTTASGRTDDHRSTTSGNGDTRSGKGMATAGGAVSSHGGKGVVTGSGAGAASHTGKGIVTAGGAVSSHGSGHAPKVQMGSGVVTASGTAAGRGVTTASTDGRGNAYGHGGKH